jgi:hypothetical protein
LNKIKANLYLNFKCSKSFLKICILMTLPFLILFASLSAVSMSSFSKNVSTEGTVRVASNASNISSTVDHSSATFVGIILLLMMIYLIILSVSSPKGTFSLSIRMGSTRKAYFLGSITYYAIICAAFSTIYTFLLILEGILFKYVGINQLNNYSFIFDKIGPVGAIRLTIYTFFISIAIISVVTMFSHLAYIIGEYGWMIIIPCVVVISFKVGPIITNFMVDIKKTDFNTDMINLIVTFVAFAISYVIISKTQIRNS